MHITHAETANFRALEAVSAPLNQFSVLIGENDVGKTRFLYALERFFAGKKLEYKSDRLKQSIENNIRIAKAMLGIRYARSTDRGTP
ncbi:MAG: AAA family ATPase [Gemmatimonadaceae bacterium]